MELNGGNVCFAASAAAAGRAAESDVTDYGAYRHFAGGVSGWQSHDQSVYKHRGHVTSVSLCRSADDVLCRPTPDVLMGKPYLRSN